MKRPPGKPRFWEGHDPKVQDASHCTGIGSVVLWLQGESKQGMNLGHLQYPISSDTQIFSSPYTIVD